MKPLPLQDLAAAVSSYLTYLSSVTHLDNLIDEGTIKYPFVEYLERKIKTKPILEKPIFQYFPKKRVDVYFEYEDNKYAFEFKYIRKNVTSLFNDYFFDILRLSYIQSKGYQAFFLVGGSKNNFERYFKNNFEQYFERREEMGKTNPSGIFHDLLFEFGTDESSNYGYKNLDLNEKKLNKAYNEFRDEYLKPFKSQDSDFDDLFSKKDYQVTTILKALELQKSSINTSSVAIWEVKNILEQAPSQIERGQLL